MKIVFIETKQTSPIITGEVFYIKQKSLEVAILWAIFQLRKLTTAPDLCGFLLNIYYVEEIKSVSRK